MKTALVTGGSRSIGAEISRRLARDGWAVAVNYHSDRECAQSVVSEITAAGGVAGAFRFDVTERSQVATATEEITERLSPVDLIVNNATGPQPFIPIEKQTWQDYLDQLTFFVKAPLDLLQCVLPDWRRRKSGCIINIGSEVVEMGNPQLTHYVAAKGAMLAMTRSLANELGADGIPVNLVAPGWIPGKRHEGLPQAMRDEYLERTAFGHFVDGRDIAGAVAFLASPEAKNITGQKISVNAGRTLL